jgi:hypothetical protein
VVHDIALQISGLLVKNSVDRRCALPARRSGRSEFSQRDWSASRGDDFYRRAVYTHWQRTFLHPMMGNFDAPSREESNVNRIN